MSTRRGCSPSRRDSTATQSRMSNAMTTTASTASAPPDPATSLPASPESDGLIEPTPGDRLSERLLAGPVTVLLGLVCLVQLLTWIPHYLTWPLWADHD